MKSKKDKKFNWPDISFPPINLWCLMSAYNFYNLRDGQGTEKVTMEVTK